MQEALININTLSMKGNEPTVGGLNRRDFLKFCSSIAATLGLSSQAAYQIAEAATNGQRPAVIWLHGQECTGCSESMLRATHPTLENLILDIISLDYHETLNVAAGHQLEAAKRESMEKNKGKYVLVIEGGIPTKDGGIYCKIGNQTILDSAKEAAANAAAIICLGSCASWGGIQSMAPNPTGAKGAPEVLSEYKNKIVTIPGCPPNPHNFLATVLQFITYGTLPELDHLNRPKFAYGRLVHENCERRAHFNAGRFAIEFGDEGHRLGYCLYKLGCKGPETYANCPAILFGDVTYGSWPVATGHGCIGCTEQGIVFQKPIYSLAEHQSATPPMAYPRIDEARGQGITPESAALAGAAVGAVIGAGAMVAARVGAATPKETKKDEEGS